MFCEMEMTKPAFKGNGTFCGSFFLLLFFHLLFRTGDGLVSFGCYCCVALQECKYVCFHIKAMLKIPLIVTDFHGTVSTVLVYIYILNSDK